jgi:hypothetical protein
MEMEEVTFLGHVSSNLLALLSNIRELSNGELNQEQPWKD